MKDYKVMFEFRPIEILLKAKGRRDALKKAREILSRKNPVKISDRYFLDEI